MTGLHYSAYALREMREIWRSCPSFLRLLVVATTISECNAFSAPFCPPLVVGAARVNDDFAGVFSEKVKARSRCFERADGQRARSRNKRGRRKKYAYESRAKEICG